LKYFGVDLSIFWILDFEGWEGVLLLHIGDVDALYRWLFAIYCPLMEPFSKGKVIKKATFFSENPKNLGLSFCRSDRDFVCQ